MVQQTVSNAQHAHASDGYPLGVSDDVLQDVVSALEDADAAAVLAHLGDLPAPDLADLIAHTPERLRPQLYMIGKTYFDFNVIVALAPELRGELLAYLSLEEIVAGIAGLDSDNAIEILQDFDNGTIATILEALPDDKRRQYEDALSYPEDSAGRLMQREVVCVTADYTVAQTKEYIRTNQALPFYFYHVYIVDGHRRLLGRISTSRLLRLDHDLRVGDVLRDILKTFTVTDDQEDIAQSFRHYSLVSAPVVSKTGRLVGMITVDDVVDVIQEEAEEDILQLNRLSRESSFYTNVRTTAYWRIKWLLVTLLNALVASYVISLFEASIKEITALSFLMTINAAMGGNSGMQVVTVVVRALATRDLRAGERWRAVFKEMRVAVITGLTCSVVLALVTSLWIGDMRLGGLLFVALMCNMLWAAFAGTLLPIIIEGMGLDPAVSAGPLLTTTTDILGYAIFLGLATFFLL